MVVKKSKLNQSIFFIEGGLGRYRKRERNEMIRKVIVISRVMKLRTLIPLIRLQREMGNMRTKTSTAATK